MAIRRVAVIEVIAILCSVTSPGCPRRRSISLNHAPGPVFHLHCLQRGVKFSEYSRNASRIRVNLFFFCRFKYGSEYKLANDRLAIPAVCAARVELHVTR